jgi:hypothetical protein
MVAADDQFTGVIVAINPCLNQQRYRVAMTSNVLVTKKFKRGSGGRTTRAEAQRRIS